MSTPRLARFVWRTLRWALGGLSALTLVAVAIVLFGDLSPFKETIEQRASLSVGMPVKITGDLRLVPRIPLGIVAERVIVGATPEETSEPFVKAKRVELGIDLLALLGAQLVVREVGVEEGVVFLKKDDERWKTLFEGQSPHSTNTTLEGIQLSETKVTYTDTEHDRVVSFVIESALIEASIHRFRVQAQTRVSGQTLSVTLEAGSIDEVLRAENDWPLALSATGQRWSIKAHGKLSPERAIDLEVLASGRSSADLFDLFDIEAPDIGEFELHTRLTGDTVSVSISDAELVSDRLEGSADLQVGILTGGLSGRVSVQHSDLDVFASDGPAADRQSVLIPPWLIDQLSHPVRIDATIEQWTTPEITIADVAVSHVTGGGRGLWRVQSTEPHADFVLGLDVTETRPRLSLEVITLAPHPILFRGIASNTSGSGQLSGSVHANGRTLTELLETLTGSVNLTGAELRLIDAPGFIGAPDLTVTDLRLEAAQGRLTDVEVRGDKGGDPLHVTLTTDGPLADPGTAVEWPFTADAELADSHWHLEGKVANPFTRALLNMHLTASGERLGRFIAGSKDGLFAFAIETRFEGNTTVFKLSDLKAQIGKSNILGSLTHASTVDTVKIASRLRIDGVDVEQLRVLFEALQADSGSEPERTLEWAGDLEIGEIQGLQKKMSSAYAHMSYLDRQLTVKNYRVSIDNVAFEGQASANFAPPAPAYELTARSGELPIEKLAQLLDFDLPISGTVKSSESTFKATGTEVSDVIPNIRFTMTLQDGDFIFYPEDLSIAVGAATLSVSGGAGQTLSASLKGYQFAQPFEADLLVKDWDAVMSDQSVDMTFNARSADTTVRVTGRAGKPLSVDDLRFDVVATAATLDTFHALGWVPKVVTGAINLRTTVSKLGDQLRLENLQATIGDTDIAGVIGIPTGEFGRLEASLTSRRMELPDLFEDVARDTTPERREFLIPNLPLAKAIPQSWVGRAIWTVGELTIAESKFEDVRVVADLKPEVAQFSYRGLTRSSGGPFSANAVIEKSEHPKASITLSATAFDLGWALPTEGPNETHWPVDIKLDLAGPGETLDGLLAYANGSLSFVGGPTRGAEFDKWELNLISRMLPQLGERPKDQLSCMVVNLGIEDGMAQGDGAVLETAHAVVAGGGVIDLRTENLGWYLSAAPRDKSLLDLTASLKIGGKLAHPELEMGAGDLAQTAGSLILGVANPFTLLRLFSTTEGGNRCQAALTSAGTTVSPGTLGTLRTRNPEGLFDFLAAPREKAERQPRAAQ